MIPGPLHARRCFQQAPQFGRCRLVVAAREDSAITSAEGVKDGMRVASCFPRLTQEFFNAGNRELFDRLQPFLVEGSGAKTFAEAAREAGMTEEAMKKAAQRMRRRYHQLFRDEIAQTVATPGEVEEELRHLCAVLSS